MDDRMILTKDNGFKACGKILSKVRKMYGMDQSDYLDKYFQKIWESHDKDRNNLIEASEVQDLFEEILKADDEKSQEVNDD